MLSKRGRGWKKGWGGRGRRGREGMIEREGERGKREGVDLLIY